MSVTKAIADKLVALGLGTQGADIFVQFMPEGDVGIVVIATIVGNKIDREIDRMRKTTFQIVVRGTEFVATQTKADNVARELFVTEETLGLFHFNFLRAMSDPVPFQRSAGGLFEFLIIFESSFIDCEAIR